MVKKSKPIRHLSLDHKKAISEGVKKYWKNYKHQETELFLYRSEIARRKAASKKTGKKYVTPKTTVKAVYKHRKVIVYEITPKLLDRKPQLRKRAPSKKELVRREIKKDERKVKIKLRKEVKKLQKVTKKVTVQVDLAQEKLAKQQARKEKARQRRLEKKRLLEETPKDVAVIDKKEVKKIEEELVEEVKETEEIATVDAAAVIGPEIPKESPSQKRIRELEDENIKLKKTITDAAQKVIDDAKEQKRLDEELKQHEQEYIYERLTEYLEISKLTTEALLNEIEIRKEDVKPILHYVTDAEDFYKNLENLQLLSGLSASQLWTMWLYA
jgi:hypothetical protein